MTTKMTDLIPQSLRLSKWFNSTENIADTLDGKENTENAEFEEGQPPPNKRIRMDRIYPPGTFSIQTRTKSTVNTLDLSKEQPSVHSNMTEEFLDQATPGPSGLSCLMSSTVQADIRDVTSHKSDLNSLTSLTNDGITNGTDDNSESSETSGCSSLIQQMNRFEGPALYSSTFSSRKRHIDDKLRFTSSLQSSKSSFLNSSSRETLSSRRPRFNESVVTNVLQRTSALSSPFYDGNTTFGGANTAGFYSHNRNFFNNSLNQLELKVPKRTNVVVTPSNVTESDSSGMSQTAKKILEALEHFSSPISDAKKIPLKNASSAVFSILSRKRAEGTKKIGLRHLARELTVPTVPDILTLKRRQKLQDTTLTVRKIVSARSNPPPSSQEYWLRVELNDGEKYRGKLKGKSKVNLEQEETVMPVNLPNIPLPITTLPNFNFSIPAPSVHFAAGKTVANKENTFTFASPIKMINVEEDVEPVKSFTFSNPIDIYDSGNKTKTNDLSSSSLAQNTGSVISSVDGTAMPNFIWSGSSTAPRLKAKVKDRQDNSMEFAMLVKPKMENITDLLRQKSNKTDSDAIGQSDLKLTSEKTHTVKTDNISASITSNIKSTSISKSWECSECLIRNNDIDKQCNACKVLRPDLEDKSLSTLTSTTDIVVQTKPVANDCFGSHFKLSKDQWECTSCYVRNKRSDNKCVACCMPKSENNTVQQTIKPQANLMEKFKPAAGSWECSGCLLRNAENVLTCPCCDASKPNSLKKISDKRRNKETITENNTVDTENIAMQASASNNSDIMNKFKPSKDSWECPGCLVRNNSSVTTCPCCGTTKLNSGDERTMREHLPTNGFGDKFIKPKDAWNCDSCLLQNDAKRMECIACQAPKPGVTKITKSLSNTDSILQFKFGIPSSTSNVSNHSSGFKFDTDKADSQSKSDTASLNGFKFVSVDALQQNSGAAQFTFGLREENKVTSEAAKSSSVITSSISTGLNTKTLEESESTKKDSQNKQETFNTPTDNNLTIVNEKPSTSIVATSTMVITPIFTFGVKKSDSEQTALNKEKEKSTTAIESVKLTEEAVITTISESTPITNKITLPTPIFSFGVPSTKSTDAIALFGSTASTNATIPCLPTFAQSTFTFSDSKIMSQPSTTITNFGQVLTSSTALSTNLSFGENKVVETIASSFTKSKNDVSTTSSIFPIVSSSTSFFNNNTINNETKTTMAFGSDKSAFTTTYNKPSGFGTTENKYPTFGGSTEAKSSIFETSETKLPVFSPSSQTPASNSLPTFGAFGSNSTPVFGSVTTHGFSAVTTTPTVFSTTKSNEPTIASNSSLFTFGSASSQQSTSGGFNFTANANSAMNSPAAKPLFTFGSNSSITQNSHNVFDGNTFATTASSTNTPNFAFNPKQETSIAFGQGTTPIFGTQTDPQTQVKSFPSSAPSSTGFNFGSTASAATSGFNFGGMPSSTPSGGFNFNPLTTSTPAVAFDPNSRPSFNFTKGSAPTSFNATPQSTGSQPRKIKKAFRRCVR
ncbi:nuclear pore complex protein Nup153-like isoform X2 [Pseudomyrmex gracilis]|nr:nuclear pore complex protein Nup153-like isoform X2 [Pseudomyrmex gracilis]